MSALPVFVEEYRDVIDRGGWPSGPWDGEPDKVVWRDEATGLDAMAKRNRLGAWCGYVGVPSGHPLHGLGYSDEPVYNLDAHGGLTYADACDDEADPASGICHISDGGPVWWFGFDCAHCFDVVPYSLAKYPEWASGDETYRDLPYVIGEVSSLAAQLAEAAS